MKDKSKMSPEEFNRDYLSKLLTNLTFLMSDVMESMWLNCEECNRRAGYEMRQEEKRHYKAMRFHLAQIRQNSRYMSVEDQIDFGHDADLMRDILYAASSRTGTDDRQMLRFLRYMLSFPDILGLDEEYDGSEAFEAYRKEMNGYAAE